MWWTVFYMASRAEGGSSICVDEMLGPKDMLDARCTAGVKYGTEILAMIPGCHMEKSYLFTRHYEDGRKPFYVYQPESHKSSAR